MKETRVSVSENPMSSSCLAITQWLLHVEATSDYMGISGKAQRKCDFEFLEGRGLSCAFLKLQCTQSLCTYYRHSINVYQAGPRSYVKSTGRLTTSYFLTKIFFHMKGDSFVFKDGVKKRRTLIFWMLSGWKRLKGASIHRDWPRRGVDLQIQGVVYLAWSH